MSAVYHDYVSIPYLQASAGFTAQGTITNAAADLAWFVVPYKCQVRRVAVVFTDANATGDTLTFEQRITAGSDTGRVVFATITKPASSQVGKYLYEDPVSSVVLNEGDEVVYKATAASGLVRIVLLVERMPEVPANQADMVAA